MADQQKNENEITQQNDIDFLEIEDDSSSLKIDDKKKPCDSVQLAYSPNESDPELNLVKEISVLDEEEQSEPAEDDNVTQPIDIDSPEVDGKCCQQVDPASSNEENEIKNDVVKPEQAQFNIDFEPEENPVDIQQESDIYAVSNDDEDDLKTTQVLDDENNTNTDNNIQAKPSIRPRSNVPTKIEISQYQPSQTFCSTSNDSQEDNVGKKPRKDVISLIKKFEQMGKIKTSKK